MGETNCPAEHHTGLWPAAVGALQEAFFLAKVNFSALCWLRWSSEAGRRFEMPRARRVRQTGWSLGAWRFLAKAGACDLLSTAGVGDSGELRGE